LVAAAMLLLLIGGAACGPPRPRPVNFALGPRSYTTEDYQRVLTRWTRHASIQKDFDKVAPFDLALDVRATFKGWDWRWAYVERYAQDYRLRESEKSVLRQKELEEASRVHEFHVAATASRYEWTDFLKPQNAMWRIVLFDDRQLEIEPSERFAVKM